MTQNCFLFLKKLAADFVANQGRAPETFDRWGDSYESDTGFHEALRDRLIRRRGAGRHGMHYPTRIGLYVAMKILEAELRTSSQLRHLRRFDEAE